MTRGMTGAALTAATAEITRPRWLARLDFDSGYTRVATGTKNLFFDSDGDSIAEEFLAVGDFGGISQIEETTEGKARRVVLTLTGIKASLMSKALSEHYQGRAARIWKAYVNEAGTIQGTPTCRFVGIMDTMPWKFTEAKLGTVSVEIVSRYVLWERALDTARYSNEDHQKRRPGDKFFEFLPQIANGKETVWGKG